VAATRLILYANGFSGLTMDQLIAEPQGEKKTLHEHFSSRTALVEAAIFNKFPGIGAETGGAWTFRPGPDPGLSSR
jgi:hypothetical protein